MTSQVRSQCSTCSRFRSAIGTGRAEPFCEAFSDGIPAAVFGNALDHRESVPGDNGIRWTSNGAAFPEWALLPKVDGGP